MDDLLLVELGRALLSEGRRSRDGQTVLPVQHTATDAGAATLSRAVEKWRRTGQQKERTTMARVADLR